MKILSRMVVSLVWVVINCRKAHIGQLVWHLRINQRRSYNNNGFEDHLENKHSGLDTKEVIIIFFQTLYLTTKITFLQLV